MEFEFESEGQQGRFFLRRQERDVAEIVYRQHNDAVLVVEHTEVDSGLEGQGVGKALVLRVVAWAREKGYTIRPVCPFAKKVLERDASFSDVLARTP